MNMRHGLRAMGPALLVAAVGCSSATEPAKTRFVIHKVVITITCSGTAAAPAPADACEAETRPISEIEEEGKKSCADTLTKQSCDVATSSCTVTATRTTTECTQVK